MTDDFDTSLRESLESELLGWMPAERLDVVRERVLRRIRFRRRCRAAAASGVAGVALVAMVLAGPMTGSGDGSRVATGPTTTAGTTGAGSAGPGPGSGPASVTTTTAGCLVACGPPVDLVSPVTTRRGGGGPRPHPLPLGTATTLPVTTLPTVPTSRTTVAPTTTVPPTSVPGSTTTTVGPPPPVTYTVTAADTGQTITIHSGDTVLVELKNCPGGTWSPPKTTDAAVLVSRAPPAGPPATALARFDAAASGQAQITAHQRSSCAAVPSAAFVITVVVAA